MKRFVNYHNINDYSCRVWGISVWYNIPDKKRNAYSYFFPFNLAFTYQVEKNKIVTTCRFVTKFSMTLMNIFSFTWHEKAGQLQQVGKFCMHLINPTVLQHVWPDVSSKFKTSLHYRALILIWHRLNMYGYFRA